MSHSHHELEFLFTCSPNASLSFAKVYLVFGTIGIHTFNHHSFLIPYREICFVLIHKSSIGRKTSSEGILLSTMKASEETGNVLPCDERIAIIGAGVAGIAAAAAFNSAGYQNIVVYDKHETLGGLWVDNYPNASGTFSTFHVTGQPIDCVSAKLKLNLANLNVIKCFLLF